MEILHVLRTLWRRRAALAVGLLAAAAVMVMGGRGGSTTSGVAYTRVTLDTPGSQLVHAAPAGADTLGWRSSVLAHLVATDATARPVAERAGIPVAQLAVVDPTLATPAVAASLPVAAAGAAVTRAPYVLSVHEPDGSLPIIAIDAVAPDRDGAARLARAAAAVLESQGSPAGARDVQPFVVQSVAPIHAKTVVSRGGRLRSAAMAAFVLVLWVAGVAFGPALLGLVPRRRRAWIA